MNIHIFDGYLVTGTFQLYEREMEIVRVGYWLAIHPVPHVGILQVKPNFLVRKSDLPGDSPRSSKPGQR